MANGHSWSSIKKYTLSEIGIFFKTIVLQEREIKAEKLSDLWMGTHLEYKDLNKVLSKLGVKNKKTKEQPTQAEINKDWNKLAKFMTGRK